MPNDLTTAALRYIADHPAEAGLIETPVPGLVIMTSTHARLPRHIVFRPSLCVIVQGAKRLMLDELRLDYAAGQALVVALEVPALGHVTMASEAEPYIGLNLDLDPAILQEVLEVLDHPPRPGEGSVGLFVADVDDELRASMLRLLKLLDRPAAIPVLYPAIMREISYWLLTGPYGGEVAKLALPDGHARRIAGAIRLLRDSFDRPLPMEELAAAARMSPSSFYQHFKTLTSMTPLQYQKQLRLLAARRRMLAEEINVETAAFGVGYESASQFSREYARMFGTPPKRDVLNLRATPAAAELVRETA
jgi:AraC-like DNA-binding protein